MHLQKLIADCSNNTWVILVMINLSLLTLSTCYFFVETVEVLFFLSIFSCVLLLFRSLSSFHLLSLYIILAPFHILLLYLCIFSLIPYLFCILHFYFLHLISFLRLPVYLFSLPLVLFTFIHESTTKLSNTIEGVKPKLKVMISCVSYRVS